MEQLKLKIIQNSQGNIEYSVLKQTFKRLHTEIAFQNYKKTFVVATMSSPQLTILRDPWVQPNEKFPHYSIFFCLRGRLFDQDNKVSLFPSSNFLQFFTKIEYLEIKKQLEKENINFTLVTNLFRVNENIDAKF